MRLIRPRADPLSLRIPGEALDDRIESLFLQSLDPPEVGHDLPADLAGGSHGLDGIQVCSCRTVLVGEGLRPDIHGTCVIRLETLHNRI